MSALPPKADMFSVGIDVCFVPVADIDGGRLSHALRRKPCPGNDILSPCWLDYPRRYG